MPEPSVALSLFATPIVVVDVPELAEVNAEIAARLVAESQRVPSWRRANVGGWHSTPDLSRRPDPAFRALIGAIVDAVGSTVGALAESIGIPALPSYRYAVTAWGMILQHGDYVTIHDHGDVHWSVAYYVDAGDEGPEPSGRLAFVDPRRSGRTIPGPALFPSAFDIAPRTGALVIFPGWLQHHVHPYRGQRPRICVSANLTMEIVS